MLARDTRRSLRRRWLVVAGVALVAVTSLAAGVLRLAASRTDRSLGDWGVRADATVVEVVSRTVARDRTPDGSIRLRFQPSGAGPRGALVDVGRAVGGYQQGDTVRIVYDPSDPSRIALVGVDRPER